MKEARQIQPFRLQTSSSSISYGCSVINNFFADSVIMILFLHIAALYFQNGFILKKFNYRSNVKNLGVVNLVVVFFAIICRLLPRSTTTDGGHGHIQRDNRFSAAQQAAVEKEDGEELLEKSKEEMEEEVEKKKKLLSRSAQQAAVDEDGEDVEVVLERSKEDPEEGVVEKKKELLPRSARQAEVEDDKDEDGEEVEVVPEKSTEEPEENEEEEVEAEENEENGPRPHRCMTKREHHHEIQLHHYHRLCNRYHQIPMNQQQFGLENGGRNSCSFPDPREESFPAPEERIFNYNQVNRYQYAPFHRPYPSAPPIPESSYYTQINSNPRTIPRVDASSSPSQQTESQTLQSRKDPLPQLPLPRRRKEREERRISTQSKTAKKGESGRFRFQFVIPIQPPQPSQSSVAQSSSPLLPAPPLPAQSFLTKLFKPNDNQKKVNLNSSLSPPPSLASPSFPPTSSVHQFFKKSSKTKKIISDVGLPPPLPPQPPPPRPSPEPPPPKKTSAQPPHGSCKLHKNTRPSSLMPQNQTVPAPKATNQGTPPRTMTNTLRRKRKQDTDGHLKKEIYVEIGYQSPLNGIAQPPPPLPFPNRGMKFVAHGDLVNIQSSSSDSIDDPLSTPCYCSSSDTNIKAKN